MKLNVPRSGNGLVHISIRLISSLEFSWANAGFSKGFFPSFCVSNFRHGIFFELPNFYGIITSMEDLSGRVLSLWEFAVETFLSLPRRRTIPWTRPFPYVFSMQKKRTPTAVFSFVHTAFLSRFASWIFHRRRTLTVSLWCFLPV